MKGERNKPGRNRPAALWVFVALFGYTATKGIEPLPLVQPLQPVTSTPVDRLSAEAIQRATADTAACTFSTECDDGQPCTSDVCSNGVCSNVLIANCVPCSPGLLCPPMDVVFIMDTSGSMRDEAAALCSGIAQVVAELRQQGVTLHANFLGITETPGGSFACLTDNVVHLLGGTVPGNGASCPFPGGTSPYESWGPATAIVAARFPWTPGAMRIVIPISDEGPCNGSQPEGCNDPGDDRDSINNAVALALANNVVISPITGTGSDDCVINLATDAALGTNGIVLQSKNPKLDLPDAIKRIFLDPCGIDDRCDDEQACTDGDQCRDGICVGRPIPGCRSCTTAAECDDQDPCTTDSCVAGACSSTPAYDVATECCNPVSGAVVTVEDDGNPCTFESCDPATGEVIHPPAPAGGACSDGNVCTLSDRCDGNGGCVGQDAATVPCATDADCLGLVCQQDIGRCRCNTVPDLSLVARVAGGCHPFNDELVVDVELGNSLTTIFGGQFVIQYDPTVLDFISIQSGAVADPASPFGVELAREIDETAGQVRYAVQAFPSAGTGTQGPAIMARLRFKPLRKCETTGLCFADDAFPWTTKLVSLGAGEPVPHTRYCTGDVYVVGADPVLTCPGSVSVNALAGRVYADLTWNPITARSECDGALPMECHGLNDASIQFANLIPTGGRFPIGSYEFKCAATDSCGSSASCQWAVDVRESNTMEVDVQFSAIMAPGLLQRCIEFELYKNCVEDAVVVQQTLDFGGLFNFPGEALHVTLKVPPGQYACATARDPRHTLRSVAHPDIVGGKYILRFEGDPALGGNWLINGNLNGDRVIDLLDEALFLAQYSATLDPNTPCDTGSAIHADLNGNGVVDTNDLTFIQRNFLATDKGTCCGTVSGGAATSEPGVISVEDLDALGLSHLRDADADHDGFLTAEEIMAFLQGEWPAEAPPPAAPDDPAP
jgi:hypothetical protein